MADKRSFKLTSQGLNLGVGICSRYKDCKQIELALQQSWCDLALDKCLQTFN